MNPNPAPFGGSFQQSPRQPQQKGCLGRNWKWMLPVGCLGLILGVVALVGAGVLVAMSAVKSSEVYQGAHKVAQTHPAAAERLGQPVKDGWFVTGNVKVDAGGGNADFQIPVSGPKNSGTLHVRAVNPDGAWMYERLDLVVGGETVSLLDRNVLRPPPGSPVDVEEDADGSYGSTEEAPEGASDDAGGGKQDVPGYEGQAAVPPDVVSGGLLDRKATSKPQPPDPALAKAARASGLVTVQVTVDETGGVVAAEAVSGHPLLRAAATTAARQAKFSPTLLGGKAVKVKGVLTYNFVLEP
jgi:TonB family protein